MSKFNILFKNISNDRIQTLFLEVFQQFTPIHRHAVEVIRRPLKSTTMQARPLINGNMFFKNYRGYQIAFSTYTKIDSTLRTRDMPESVLKGWFAHELGHVMDYLNRPWYYLIGMGIGYTFLKSVRMGMEKKADLYAIQYGFGQEILATKNYILSHASIPLKYRQQISKYYLSPAEAEQLIAQQETLEIDNM